MLRPPVAKDWRTHNSAQKIGTPREKPQCDRSLTNQLSPNPQKKVIKRWMSVFTKHLNKGSQTGLETLTNAVELIAPQGRGINQKRVRNAKALQTKARENSHLLFITTYPEPHNGACATPVPMQGQDTSRSPKADGRFSAI